MPAAEHGLTRTRNAGHQTSPRTMTSETVNFDIGVFRLLALEDAEREAADLVRMNLAVACGIPRMAMLVCLNPTCKGWSV